MPRGDRIYLREDGSRIYTRRFSCDMPASFHKALTDLAAQRGLSLSALILPWIEDGLQQGIQLQVEQWPKDEAIKQLMIRLPLKLYQEILGEGRKKLPYGLVPRWILAGYRRETEIIGESDQVDASI